jgi:phosphatidylserine/phosphatidylglycerophosphate/cardiolipin synthase-like enzyme
MSNTTDFVSSDHSETLPEGTVDAFEPSWAADAPRGGRVVLNRVLKESAVVPLFLAQTFVQSLRDVGYDSTTSALCEHDVALIDSAKHEIDFAAYVLTDWPVIQALTRAADRGVKVRIYLDGTQFAEREPAKVFDDLAETPGVEIRIKHKTSVPMHLKSYEIDGRLLRTGAANFSASGLKRQDNDLVIIESPEAAVAFKHVFDTLFDSGEGQAKRKAK